MGVSTDAILFYGIAYDDNENTFDLEIENGEWEDLLLSKVGMADDSGLFNKEGDYAMPEGKERKAAEKKRDDWHEKKTKYLDSLGVEVGIHCSIDYPMYRVVVCESEIRVPRGYIEHVTALDVGEDWDDKIKYFCKLLGVKYKKPQWNLVSFWG